MRRVILVVLCLAYGCGDDGGGTPRDASIDGPDPSLLTEVALVPNNVNGDLDILFVIDDSPSMLDKQTNLKASFASFVTALSAGGLPNVHIGVVTTDMGAKGADDATFGASIGSGPGSCSMLGKDGQLQTFTSTMINGKFLSNIEGVGNYTGALTDRFNEIASAGAAGCGFEQAFHAMQRALDPSNTPNAGFLRESARLGVIVLSDEDDCSMSRSTLMGNDPMFGPLQSFRCTRWGVTCDVAGTTPTEMNNLGAKAGCHSNEQSAYLADVGRYTAFLKGLKPDPRAVLFAGIAGDLSSFVVEDRTPPGGGSAVRALAHSCQYTGANNAIEYGDPAVRVAQLAASMPRNTMASVCSGDLSSAMTDIGLRLKPLVGDGCLQRQIAQPTACLAFDVDGVGAVTPVRLCNAAATPPCFRIIEDASVCPTGYQNFKVDIVRTVPVGDDVWTSVRCVL